MPSEYYWNITGVGDSPQAFMTGMNTWTGDAIGLLFVVGIMVVSFWAVKNNYPIEHAVITSSFLGAVGSYFLNVMGLIVDPLIISIPTGIFLASVFVIIVMKFK